MIFYKKDKIEDLFCPKCKNCLYRSTYFEHYPTFPYGCFECDELFTEEQVKKAETIINTNGADNATQTEQATLSPSKTCRNLSNFCEAVADSKSGKDKK